VYVDFNFTRRLRKERGGGNIVPFSNTSMTLSSNDSGESILSLSSFSILPRCVCACVHVCVVWFVCVYVCACVNMMYICV